MMLMVVIEERQSGFNNHAGCTAAACTTEPSTNEFAEGYSTPQLIACGGLAGSDHQSPSIWLADWRMTVTT